MKIISVKFSDASRGYRDVTSGTNVLMATTISDFSVSFLLRLYDSYQVLDIVK